MSGRRTLFRSSSGPWSQCCRSSRWGQALPGLGCALLLLAACAGPAQEAEGSPESQVCNGFVELCDRPFSEVALAATHNSMANAEAGWWVPNQEFGLSRQLEDGIRGLLLDTHYWDDQLYLCHDDCSLGSQLLVEGLSEIAQFLDARPGEVVAILFQDGISPADTESAFAAVGLDDRVYTHSAGSGWPTLGELSQSRQQLVVGAEFSGPPPNWYHHAWDLYFDTPYDFDSQDAFSCASHRGEEQSELFLVNHWLSGPLSRVSNAEQVNQYSVLRQRLEDCWAERGQIPNLVAVDFYDRGDLIQVVDALNGVSR